MFRIKILYPAFCLLALIIFYVLHRYVNVEYSFINLALLLSVPLGCVYSKKTSYIIAASSWLLLPISLFFCKMDVPNSALPIILFNAAFLGAIRYRSFADSVIKRYEAQEKERDESVKIYSKELEELYERERRTRDQELAVVKLYEMTKKMSEGLKFDDIVNIFSLLLKENLVFKRCSLVILRQPDVGFAIDKLYNIYSDETNGNKDSGADMKEVIDYFMHEDKKEVYATRKEGSPFFARFGIKEEARTFAAIPLLSEKKVVGALVIEDLPAIGLERAIIMSMQFALEIKKVLLYEKVEELAITDGLTGVYVRRYFLERFTEELKRSQRYDFSFAFLMIDIDDFKKRNDTYGHLVGDVILKEVARMLKESVREIDLVARYGGEEFSMLLPETDRTGAKLVAERIREKISANVFKAYDEKLSLTVSIGLAVYPEDTDDGKELIEHADAALYVAKRSGKNVVCEYKK